METGQLEWRVANLDEPGNEHFVTDYETGHRFRRLCRTPERPTARMAPPGPRLGTHRRRIQVQELRRRAGPRLPGAGAVTGGFWFAVGSALWLGILTSISPCPLATNVRRHLLHRPAPRQPPRCPIHRPALHPRPDDRLRRPRCLTRFQPALCSAGLRLAPAIHEQSPRPGPDPGRHAPDRPASVQYQGL